MRRCSGFDLGSRGDGDAGNSRKIGHCQRGIRVEVVRLYEALEKIPTHLGRLIGALRREIEDIMLLPEGGIENGVVLTWVQRSSLNPSLHRVKEAFTSPATVYLIAALCTYTTHRIFLRDETKRIRPTTNLTPEDLF